jgi:hypothetical protein
MASVTLPSGIKAELMNVDELTAGVKLAAQRAVSVTLKDGKMVMSLAMSEDIKIATIAAVLKSWDSALEANQHGIEQLGIKDYNALVGFCKEHLELLKSTPDKSDSAEA